MARLEEFDRPLTPAELAERRRRLSLLSPHHVADAYRQAHEACRMEGDRLPRASRGSGIGNGLEAAVGVEEEGAGGEGNNCRMSPTDLAAWVGATSGLGGLLWNIYLKRSAGPKLAITAIANMVMMPAPPGNPKYLSVTVRNVGTATTTLNNLTLQVYTSSWRRRRRKAATNFVVANYQGPQFPYKLEVGSEWRALMPQDDRFRHLLDAGNLWCGVWHSFSKFPAQAPILRPAA
jgi:hypothetical protein